MNPSVSFQETVANLLAERKALRQLSQDLTRWLILSERDHVRQTEDKIAELVLEPLDHLSPRERVAAGFLAQAVQNMIAGFKDATLIDNPSQYWQRYSPVPGLVTDAWPVALRERLIALCGPLDETLSTMLAAA